MRVLIITLLAFWAASGLACAWVRLSDDGARVQVVANTEVLGCDRVGTTKARVLHDIWFVPRQQSVVDRELRTLARNEAFKLEGNTVTPMPARAPGEQEFAVYRCND